MMDEGWDVASVAETLGSISRTTGKLKKTKEYEALSSNLSSTKKKKE
jgi:hypothetical protein